MIKFDAKACQDLSCLVPNNKSSDNDKFHFQSLVKQGLPNADENICEKKTHTNNSGLLSDDRTKFGFLSLDSQMLSDIYTKNLSCNSQVLLNEVATILDKMVLTNKQTTLLHVRQNGKTDNLSIQVAADGYESIRNRAGKLINVSQEFVINEMEYDRSPNNKQCNRNSDGDFNSSKIYSFIQSSIALGQFDTVGSIRESDTYPIFESIAEVKINSVTTALVKTTRLTSVNMKGGDAQFYFGFSRNKTLESSGPKPEKICYKSQSSNVLSERERYNSTYFKIVDLGFDYRIYYRDFNNKLTIEQLVSYLDYFSTGNHRKAHLVYNGVKRTLHGY
ncbi:TPA: hypothetical protein RQK93_000698 [Vibrio vulnificus]|nr:hypothetical protein [Vibrio vulnificus]